MAAFTQRQATPKKGQAYRGSVVRKFDSSDDDDSSDLSDSDEEQSWKRRKSAPAPATQMMPSRDSALDRDLSSARPRPDSRFGLESSRSGAGGSGAKRRRNNIWGSVVAEQNQETVERELTQFGVESDVLERDVESYYRQAQQPQLGLVANLPPEPIPQRGRKIVKEVGEEDDDAWLAEHSPPHRLKEEREENADEDHLEKTAHPDLRERLMKRGSMVADKFRHSNVKSRLGARRDECQEDTIMKSVEIDPGSGAKVVAGQLAYSLQEPKRNLVMRIVKVLGIEKSLEIWKKTEEIEHDGGMMIRDQSRRRSPGGVFIQLMKTDPNVSHEDVKLIFAEEKANFEVDKKKRRRHTRKHKHRSSMDVDSHDNKNAEERMEDVGEDLDPGKVEDTIEGNSSGEEEELKCMNQPEAGQKGWDFFKPEEGAREGAHSIPFPKQEYDCEDLKEHNDGILNFMPDIRQEDIPKRNKDSDPEDGEVLDDDDDDN